MKLNFGKPKEIPVPEPKKIPQSQMLKVETPDLPEFDEPKPQEVTLEQVMAQLFAEILEVKRVQEVQNKYLQYLKGKIDEATK